ncbi:MAG TPA: hypothetical protein VEX68_20440, partial [Bryobacteraceae bacterium]|nr:hypothetical protein [Bryobacteraceae bacterium]
MFRTSVDGERTGYTIGASVVRANHLPDRALPRTYPPNYRVDDDPLRGRRRVDRKLGILQQSDVCCQVLRSGPNT